MIVAVGTVGVNGLRQDLLLERFAAAAAVVVRSEGGLGDDAISWDGRQPRPFSNGRAVLVVGKTW